MPKLNKQTAGKAEKAEDGFAPIPEDIYVCKLKDVDGSRSGAKGPYWSWEFEIAGGEFKGRRLWTNTSLAENALWKLKEIFGAFGVGTDTDTDDLCGELVRVSVTQRLIEQGQRKGEIGNQVAKVMAFNGDPEEFAAGDGDGEFKGEPEDIY